MMAHNSIGELLRDPEFWRVFFEGLPSCAAMDAEERALADVARRAGVPLSRVKEAMQVYLRFSCRPFGPDPKIHPGSDAIN